MNEKYYLGIIDYIAIALSFAIAAAIGIKFRSSGARQGTTGEYLMAGRNMPKFPVVLSFVVTNVSAVTLLGIPAEVYKYGSQTIVISFAIPVGVVLSAYIVMPVYFQCGVSSIYEFLEYRFGKLTRSVISALFILQMIIYMAVSLYGPALALSAVTNLSIETSIIVMGFICMFYCSVGGLKAVLWTDVFQAALMFMCILPVYIACCIDSGGISNVYERVKKGNRLQFFNFSLDVTTRFTFWNTVLRSLSTGFGNYGTSQIEVQRMISLGSYERALSATLWTTLPLLFLILCCNGLGLILYSVFYMCDPVAAQDETGVSKYDELLPYYIVKRFNTIPGLTGLCVAGIFSGSLSTISSALNSVSTVTVIDFIQSFWTPNRQSETKMLLVSKILVVLYGTICIGLAFSFIFTRSILQAASVLVSMIEGPIIAVFLIGVLTTMGTDKSILLGLVCGVAFSGWIGFEVLFHGYPQTPLPFRSDGCEKNGNMSYGYDKYLQNFTSIQNSTDHLAIELSSENENWLHNLSFMWIPTFSFLATLCITLIFSFTIDCNKRARYPDMKCLSPVTRFWMSRPTVEKGYTTNCVPTELEELSHERTEL